MLASNNPLVTTNKSYFFFLLVFLLASKNLFLVRDWWIKSSPHQIDDFCFKLNVELGGEAYAKIINKATDVCQVVLIFAFTMKIVKYTSLLAKNIFGNFGTTK